MSWLFDSLTLNLYSMKRNVLILLVILFSLNIIDAQWYQRKCGVTDINNCTEDQYVCLWNKSTKLIRTGGITTAIGTTGIIAGVLAINDESMDIVGTIFIGGFGLAGGIILDCIGIPVFMTGAVRRSSLRNIPGYTGPVSGSLRITPSFQINQLYNTRCLSMGVTLHFSLV